MNNILDLDDNTFVRLNKDRTFLFYGEEIMERHALDYFGHDSKEYKLALWCRDTFGDPTQCFLDIGANVGLYTVLLAKSFKQTYAFEPITRTYKNLNKSVALNDLDNVETSNVALSDVKGVFPMIRCGNSYGGSTLLTQIGEIMDKNGFGHDLFGQEDVYVTTLDSFNIVDPIGLIKIDVEGSEADVIIGGIQTIKRNNNPPILFETWSENTCSPREMAPLVAQIRKRMFQIMDCVGYNCLRQINDMEHMFLATRDETKTTTTTNTKQVFIETL